MIDVKENIDKKYSIINELRTLRRQIMSDNKEKVTLLCILFVLIYSMSLNLWQYNQKNRSKSSDEDFFKYSILISLHYSDITFHPERVSRLRMFENKYNSNHITLNEFEINNPNISLTVFDENNNIVYTSSNNSTNKAQIVKLKDNRYAAVKPLKNKFIKLNKILESFSHLELSEHMLQNILKNKIEGIEFKTKIINLRKKMSII